jgi:hypothetical protein
LGIRPVRGESRFTTCAYRFVILEVSAKRGGAAKLGRHFWRRPNVPLEAQGCDHITWPPHPDCEVEQVFRQANRDGYVIYRDEGVYTLVSPDAMEDFSFSGVWWLPRGLAAHDLGIAGLARADS